MKIQDVDARLLTLMIICNMREPRQQPSVTPTAHKATGKSKRVSAKRTRRTANDVREG